MISRPPRLYHDDDIRYITVGGRRVNIESPMPDNDLVQFLVDKVQVKSAPARDASPLDNEPGEGLYDYQIKDMMKRYKRFVGVISADEIDTLPAKKRIGFIMNLDKRDQPGSHWVACYIDTVHDRSVEYYDSFGREPSLSFLRQIKDLITRISPPTYLKLKINRIIQQRVTSDNCGYFSMKFLVDRFHGKPFKESTHYHDVNNGERSIEHFKEQFAKFGYI